VNKLFASLSLTLFLVLGAGAQDQQAGSVNVPFDFVAAGKMLPAGTYRIGRVSDDALNGITISSYDNRSAAYVLPNEFTSRPSSDVKVIFKQVGDNYVVSAVQTAEGTYLVPVSPRAGAVARLKHEGRLSASEAQ
jgi:hypothetical protein